MHNEIKKNIKNIWKKKIQCVQETKNQTTENAIVN